MREISKKVLLVCTLMSAGLVNAQDRPVAMNYTDYTGDSFVANWDLAGSNSNVLLSVFGSGENVFVSENFRGINSNGGKIDQSNPNYPSGWEVSVSEFGTTDIGYDGKNNRLILDETGDYVSTTLIVGSNLTDFTINAALVNAEGITKENSSIFMIDYYDSDGVRIAGGQIESLYFGLKPSLSMKEALGVEPVDVGSIRISIANEEGRNVGDLMLESLSYTYSKPLYVLNQQPVQGNSYKVQNLDPDKVYWYYLQGEKGGVKSTESNIVRVDGFLTPKATKATNITLNSYTANWERLPKATGYKVQNYEYIRVKESGDMSIVSETFSKATEGSVEMPVKVTDPDLVTDNLGWTGNNLIMAPGMLGASAGRFPMNLSYVYSPKMNLSGQGGKYKISIKARGVAGDYLSVYRVGYMIDTNGDGNPDNLNIHKTVPFDENGLLVDSWEMTDGAVGMMLSFEENRMRQFLIDEVVITQRVEAGTIMTYMREMAEIKDGAVTSYVFGNLKEGGEYGYDVVGVRVDDFLNNEQSGKSGLVKVQCMASVEDMLAGESAKVSVAGNVLSVSLANEAQIEVYNLQGRLVASVSGVAGQNDLTVPAGIYVLRAGGSVFKLIVR